MRKKIAILRDAWQLSAPYWCSEVRWRARFLLFVVLALNLVIVGTAVLFTVWQGAFFNSLEDKNWANFLRLLVLWTYDTDTGFAPGFLLTAAIFVPATVYANYFKQTLQIHWREWQTERFVQQWLTDGTYYQLEVLDLETDNPDQRIAEDIRLFVDHVLDLLVGFLRALVTLLSFLVVLWVLSGSVQLFGESSKGALVWIALIYATVGTALIHLIGKRLIGLNFNRERVEADYRYGLMRLRENAEPIAFFRSETNERADSENRFAAIVSNWRSIIQTTKNMLFFQTSFGQLALVVPFAIVAPAYFSGRIQLGVIFQTSNAFVQVQESLSWIVLNYERLTEWAATTHRLTRFEITMAEVKIRRKSIALSANKDDLLSFDNVILTLPSGRELVTANDISISKGDRIWLSGPSGAGKSTTLRAIAGLWSTGTGEISIPKGNQLFLPQQPYMPAGSLKRCICYPSLQEEFSDLQVVEALDSVGLGHLSSKIDTDDAWHRLLSGGERQRISFARALLLQPEWLFMDEATANLDEAAEIHCYELLRRQLPRTTYISILHRSVMAKYYNRAFVLENGTLTERTMNKLDQPI